MTTRDRILQSAAEILASEQLDALTMDRLAAHAGLSKGGVFYHFRSKEEVVLAMTQMLIQQFEAEVDAATQKGMSFPEAFIAETLEECGEDERLIAAVISASMSDPAVVETLKRHGDQMRARLLEAGVEPAHVTLLITAVHGVFVQGCIGLRISASDRIQLRHMFQRLIQPSPERQLAEVFTSALRGYAAEVGEAQIIARVDA